MAQQTSFSATMGEFQTRGDDFLHLKNSQGSVVGGIDNTGTGFGTMQGGFVPPVTKVLYVDGGRTDSYTADGSLLKPFKTIMAAVNQVITNGDNSDSVGYAVAILTGTYSETIVLENLNLVNLFFIGDNTVNVGGFQSTTNNNNLRSLYFRGINFNVTSGVFSVTSNGGAFSITGLIFDRCDITTNVWTFNGTANQWNLYDTNISVVTANFSGAHLGLWGNRAIVTGGVINLTNSSVFQLGRGARNGSDVTIDSTSTYNLLQGARQDNTSSGVTVNGNFTNRISHVTCPIVVNSGGTYSEHGGHHEGALTINAGGSYTQVGVEGVGGLVLGAAAPTVPANEVGLGGTTSATATAGGGSLPAAPAGFWVVNIGGTLQKIPYYNS